jgi:hypothetical protein
MHPYATDLDKRRYVPLSVAIASIVAAWSSSALLVALKLNLPWWVDAPSVLGFYGLFFVAFDKRLWRLSPMRRLLGMPDLNGTYRGYVRSSFDRHRSRYAAILRIRQTWTEINIVMTTRTSSGQSVNASIITETGTLTYEYLNEPKAGTIGTMHIHRGTGTLNLVSDGRLEGEYYSGRDRQTYGLMHFVRVEEMP